MISSSIHHFNLNFRQFISNLFNPTSIQQKYNAMPGASDLKGGNFLIVDNDPFSRFIVGRNIENLQGCVAIAESAAEALEQMKDNTFTAVLVDIQLPDLHTINQSLRKLPLVALTSVKTEELRKELIKAGINDWMEKEINPDLLLQKLSSYIK